MVRATAAATRPIPVLWPLESRRPSSTRTPAPVASDTRLDGLRHTGHPATVEQNVRRWLIACSCCSSASSSSSSLGTDRHDSAVDQWHCDRRPIADRHLGDLDRRTHLVCLPVAGLQRAGRRLPERERSDGLELRAGRERRRQHRARRGEREQRGRFDVRAIDRDRDCRRRPAAAAAATTPPPTASFTYSPTAPVTGQAVTFNGASSTCPDGPCTYEWSDDGGTTRPIPALWPLGSGQTLSFTFSGTGTKYVRLVVTDATDQTATVEHNVVVEEPAPPPPVAPSNTGLPAVTGTPEVGQTLTASSGRWSGSTPISYAYQWQDCNSAGESCLNIGAATASSYKLLASDVGHTLRAVVSASNAGGSTQASSAATATVVAEPPPPPPSAPVNTVLPSVSGSAVEGETLSTSSGTWTGSPTSYAHQWQDCNASGTGCVSVSGATVSSYKLTASDVGHTLRAVVTASNAGGSTSASSAPTATVTSVVIGPEEPSLTRKECFENPETEGTSRIEACGYPGANNVGVEKSALEHGLTTASGTIRLTGEEHFENKRLTGAIVIAWNARNVVIKNDEIIDTGSCPAPHFSLNDGCVGNAVEFERRGSGGGEEINEAAKGTHIVHVKVGGTEKHGPNTVQTCIDARWNSPYVAEYVNTEHCSGFKLNAGGEMNHDYCPSNYEIGGEHYECVTDEGDELNATTLHTPLVIKNSTIFQPPIKQSVESSGLTAAIFQQSIYGSIQETILEKDLIAGGNFSVYFGEESGQTYKLTGPDTVRYNRFARCTSSSCPDSHGYFEEIGQYHIAAFYNESKMTWTHNFIDNNLEECKLGVGLCY